MKKILIALCLGCLGIGNAWGTVASIPSGTFDCSTIQDISSIGGSTSNTGCTTAGFFLLKANSSDADTLICAGAYLSENYSTLTWVNTDSKSTSSDSWDSKYHFKGRTSYNSGGNAKRVNIQSTQQTLAFRVKNCKEVAILGKGNSSSRYLYVKATELDAEGAATSTVIQGRNVNNSSVDSSKVTLDVSKEYFILIQASSNNNASLYEVSFISKDPCTAITPTLSYASTTLTVGDNSATPTVSGNTGSGAVTYTSSNTDVATVASTGVVTAVAAGSATITASIAANGGYCANTATASFTINAAGGCSSPSITNPSAATYNRGASATALSVTASATNPGTITYQWKQCATADGSYTNVASGGTSYSYTPSTSTVGTMYYKCVASFSGGCTAQTSSAALITVNCATPTITTQPVADTHCQTDADYVLSVTPAAQTGASWGYQWQKSTDNGTTPFANISGATSSSYTVPDADLLADTDKQIYYRCVVTCNTGSKTVNSNSVAVKALLTPGLSISLKP